MNTRKYTMVPGELWFNSKFKDLPTDIDRYFFLYLLTCGHQNLAGVYTLPPGYAASDLGWTPEDYRKRLAILVSVDLIKTDPLTDEVMIVGWFGWNPVSGSPMVRRGIQRLTSTIKSPSLRAALEESLREARSQEAPPTEQEDRAYNLGKTPYMQRQR